MVHTLGTAKFIRGYLADGENVAIANKYEVVCRLLIGIFTFYLGLF